MTISVIGFLVAAVVVILVLWAADRLLSAFGVADPFRTVVWVILVVVGILFLLNMTFGFPSVRIT